MSRVYSFESGIEPEIEAFHSSIQVSTKHKKDGEHSLEWKVTDGAFLKFHTTIGYQPFQEGSFNQARDTFVFWIYMEEENSSGNSLQFDFLKQGKSCCHFQFCLDFTGWRTAWVPYESMEGKAESEMNEMVITANVKEEKIIYLDQIIVCVPIDPRHPTRDRQVPFLNLHADKAANSHWLSLYRFSELMKEHLEENEISSPLPLKDMLLKEEIETITRRFEEYLLSHSPYYEDKETKKESVAENKSDKLKGLEENEKKRLLEVYEKFEIREEDGFIRGVTIDAACHKAAYPEDEKEELKRRTASIDIKQCAKWMLDMAYLWHMKEPEQKQELEEKFIQLLLHLFDQGWADGSSLGTTHHLGYPMRAYYSALFLMRKPLKERGLQKKASDAMAWFSGLGRVFRNEKEMRFESMDTLNTLLQGMLGAALMRECDEERHICLSAIKDFLSTCMKPAPGLEGPFKEDGSAYHHCNHYPAYAMGGFTGVAPVFYFFQRTAYSIARTAQETMKKALLSMRLYCNRYNWLISMSSRHPRGVGEMSQISTLEPFFYMAITGTPDKSSEIDADMASALLRLCEFMDYPKAEYLKDLGYQKENDPQGHFTMNYACCSLHRKDYWLAGVRGHSRYLWGNEIYEHNNLYGRYITYGNLQILANGMPINQIDSGYYQEGWDWNCWPGTTAVHLPLDRLRANVCNVDALSGFEEMLISDEAFAGGTQLSVFDENKGIEGAKDKPVAGEYGIFAMKLHGHAKYDGSQRARKSWFFFEDRIICLGSAIENTDFEHDTRTTLFQNYLLMDENPTYINKTEAITGLHTNFKSDKEALWIMDRTGNGYYIPEGQEVHVTRCMQYSRSQDTDTPTQAPFEKAWIDHGISPQNRTYEYLIQVQIQDVKRMETLINTYEKEGFPYRVCRADRIAHIVKDMKSETISYVFFEIPNTKEPLPYGVISSIDTPCLVMERKVRGFLQLAICDPDLRFYEGIETDQITADGVQKEVSLYSRNWRSHSSIGKNLRIYLNGKWSLKEEKESVLCDYQGETTILQIFCISARTTDIILYQNK